MRLLRHRPPQRRGPDGDAAHHRRHVSLFLRQSIHAQRRDLRQVIARLHAREGLRDGIDYQGGDDDGRGRGFVFIAPTVRPSKVTGEPLPLPLGYISSTCRH